MIALVTNVSSMGTFLYPNWHGNRGRFPGTGNTHLKYKRAIKRAKADAFSSARAAAVTAQVGTDPITYVMLYPQYHTRCIQLSCSPNGNASVRYAKAHTTSIADVLMLVGTLEV